MGSAQPITAISTSPPASAARRSPDVSRAPSSRLISAPLLPTSEPPMKPPTMPAATAVRRPAIAASGSSESFHGIGIQM